MIPCACSTPAGLTTAPIDAETLLRKCSGFQSSFADLADRLGCELRQCEVEEDVRAARLQLDDVGLDRRLGRLVAALRDDHRRLVAEPVLQALEIVLAVVVVLVEDGDLRVRLFLQEILRIDARLGLVARLPADGPREVLRVVEFRGAGDHEQLRHLLLGQIPLDRRVDGGTGRSEHRQHLVAFDQLADLLDGLGRAARVIVGDEIDLAAVDAALGIDLLEVGDHRLGNIAGRGIRAAVRAHVADLDFGIACAGVIFLLRECTSTGQHCHHDSGDTCSNPHCLLPPKDNSIVASALRIARLSTRE